MGRKAVDSRVVHVTLPKDLGEAVQRYADTCEIGLGTAIRQLVAMHQHQLDDLARLHAAAKAGNHKAVQKALQHMVGNQLAGVLLADREPPK